jgi:transcriptional regulator with XRE-family HTH domain
MASNIQENIRNIRVLKNIPQGEMADRLGISLSSYGKLERGATQMKMHHLEELSEIFGMPSFDIVNFESPLSGLSVAEEPAVEVNSEVKSSPELLRERVRFFEETNPILKQQLLDKDEIISMLRKRVLSH